MEKEKVSVSTIARTIFLIVSLINQIGVFMGWNPLALDESTIYETASMAAVVISSILAWWKNNSFTQAALLGDKMKDEVKAMNQLDRTYTDDRRDMIDVEEVEIYHEDH